MMSKTCELKRIFQIDRLIRANKYPNAGHLAVELGVTERMIYKDRTYLIEKLGAPLAFHKERKGWYYTEPTWTLPTAIVTRGELLAFLLAVEAAQRQLGPSLQSELEAAVQKIGRGLQGHIAVDLDQLRHHFSFAAPASARVDEETLTSLYEAIERQRIVELNYFSAHRGQSSRRNLEPHHLYLASGEWLLLAYDRTKASIRCFNAARISNLKLTPQGFARQHDFCPNTYLKNAFRFETGAPPQEVAIRFDRVQGIYIRERHWHPSQTLEDQDDGGVILRFQAGGMGEIARWVLQYGAHAQVLGPPELKQKVADQVRGLAAAYL